MKKILIFSLAYYPKHVGGAEVAIKQITDRIESSDIEFHMVCLRFDSTLPREEKVGNVHVHRIGMSRPNPTASDLKSFPLHFNKHLFQFLAAWKALSLHRQYRFDAIWAMMAHSCGVPAAIFKLFHKKVPYILTLQEGDPPAHIERLMRPLWMLFVRAFTRADMVQTISTFLGAWARRRGFTGPLEVIPNAVDVTHFSKEHPAHEIEALKSKLGKKAGDIYLITTSRLVYKNAVDDVIRAMKDLPAHAHFLVLGIGPDEKMLKDLVGELRLENRVRFLGQVDHAELPKYLKVSDIFIRPSRSEGMGNSFVEAMAAGLPVIATQEGGIADFLFDARRNPGTSPTGFVVDANSPKQIVKVVERMLSEPEEVRRVVENAHRMVVAKYDWEIIARDMRTRVFTPVLNHHA